MLQITKKKLSRKKLIVIIASTCISALFAAPFVYAALQPDHFPFEPPIEEQARLQYDALISGEDIPMPIPLVVGGTELKEHSLDALRDTMTTAGFKEVTGANLNEFTQDVQSQFKSDPMFASPDEKVLVVWKDKPNMLLNRKAIFVFASKRELSKTEIESFFSDGCGSITSLPLGVELGSSTSDALTRTRWIDRDYRFMRGPRRLGRPPYETISLNRGCYIYLLHFRERRLTWVTIFDIRIYFESEVTGMNEEQAIEYLGHSFGNRSAMERLDRAFGNLRNKFSR